MHPVWLPMSYFLTEPTFSSLHQPPLLSSLLPLLLLLNDVGVPLTSL